MIAEPNTGGTTGSRAVAILYLSAMLHGLTLVSYPASSAVLKTMHGFTDAQYGAIFLPQVAAAVLGALAGGSFAGRLGLKNLLLAALLVNALSQLLLAATVGLSADMALVVVLIGTACLGLAFGISGAPLNGLPPLLFPNKRDTALVALHTLLGLGLALGPLIASPFVMAGFWVGFPLLLAAISGLLALGVMLERYPNALPRPAHMTKADQKVPMADPMPLPQPITQAGNSHPVHTPGFWLFAAICVLYAFAEGTFGNWAVLYLQDVKNLPDTVAAAGLSVFWAAMVAGRLLISILVLRISPQRIWIFLPVLMAGVFLLMPYANTAVLGIGLFALAGLACSGFFPLSIGLASRRFEDHVPWVSSMLIAALMIGVGLGSYVIGILRELFSLELLYQLSAVYPAAVLILAFSMRESRS